MKNLVIVVTTCTLTAFVVSVLDGRPENLSLLFGSFLGAALLRFQDWFDARAEEIEGAD